MSNALTHDASALILASTTDAKTKTAAPANEPAPSDTPVGYRWVSKRWRVLPDGSRDYAAYHGKTAFRYLLPLSSHLPAPKH
jgi:hypothetical protein